MYNGIFAGGGFRTNFEMIVLSKRPPHSNHLTGLLNMFKRKLCQPIPVEVPSVRVTARYVVQRVLNVFARVLLLFSVQRYCSCIRL